MADNINVRIEDNSGEVLAELNRKIELTLKALGMDAEKYAKEDCPVNSGRLRNSITYATKKEQSPPNTNKHPRGQTDAEPPDYATHATPEKGAVYIGSNVEYAAAVEFKDSAHRVGKAHFLRDAVAKHRDEYKATIEAGLK